MSGDDVRTTYDGLSWSDITPSYLRYAVTAFQRRAMIHRWWRQLQLSVEDLLPSMEPRTNIAIMGRENVGKTVLNEAIQMRTRELSFDLPEASYDAERDLITVGKWSNVITIVPGQKVKQNDVWRRKVFSADNRLNGVIYVASYGYSVPRDLTLKNDLLNDVETLQGLRDHVLEREADEFRAVCAEIRRCYNETQRPAWLLVAVTKADLFADQLEEVERHYSFSADPGVGPNQSPSFYSIYKTEIAERIGSDHLRAAAVPVSSFTEDFTWGKETVKATITDADRQAFLNHLIATMNRLTLT